MILTRLEEIFTSKIDAVEQYINSSLGDFADDYDIDGIFGEAFE